VNTTSSPPGFVQTQEYSFLQEQQRKSKGRKKRIFLYMIFKFKRVEMNESPNFLPEK
jgi:hypothetical protein